MADKKAKADFIFYIVATAIGLAVFLCVFAFNTQLKGHMQAAGTGWNVLGVILFIASHVWLWKANDWSVGSVAGHPGTLWIFGVLLAIAVSCGFTFG
jgi:hypothetical protein